MTRKITKIKHKNLKKYKNTKINRKTKHRGGWLFSYSDLGKSYNNQEKKTKKVSKNIRFNDGILEFYNSLTGEWMKEYNDEATDENKYLRYYYNQKKKRYYLADAFLYHNNPSSKVLLDSNGKILAMRIMTNDDGKLIGPMYQYKIKSKDGSATFKLTLDNQKKIAINLQKSLFRLPKLSGENSEPVYVIDKINGQKVIGLEYQTKGENNKNQGSIPIYNIVSVRIFNARKLTGNTNRSDQLYYNYKLKPGILTDKDEIFFGKISFLINGKAYFNLKNNELYGNRHTIQVNPQNLNSSNEESQETDVLNNSPTPTKLVFPNKYYTT
jgi:hypothetical protein